MHNQKKRGQIYFLVSENKSVPFSLHKEEGLFVVFKQIELGGIMRILTVVIAALFVGPAAGQPVYKCLHANGDVSYQDRSCSATASAVKSVVKIVDVSEEARVAEAGQRAVQRFPFLDSTTGNGNPIAIRAVADRRDILIAQGLPAAEALARAVDDVAPSFERQQYTSLQQPAAIPGRTSADGIAAALAYHERENQAERDRQAQAHAAEDQRLQQRQAQQGVSVFDEGPAANAARTRNNYIQRTLSGTHGTTAREKREVGTLTVGGQVSDTYYVRPSEGQRRFHDEETDRSCWVRDGARARCE